MSDKAWTAAVPSVEVQDIVSRHLREPYARLVIPESDGSFRAEILEFPGCFATGLSPAEALSDLEDAARGWLEAVIAQRQNIPLPVETGSYSGKLALRLPKSLHKKAARVAAKEGVSLNQFIVYALAEHLGERGKTITQNIVGLIFNPVQANSSLNFMSNIGPFLSKQMTISQAMPIEADHG